MPIVWSAPKNGSSERRSPASAVRCFATTCVPYTSVFGDATDSNLNERTCDFKPMPAIAKD
jgi:hypothetical protein